MRDETPDLLRLPHGLPRRPRPSGAHPRRARCARAEPARRGRASSRTSTPPPRPSPTASTCCAATRANLSAGVGPVAHPGLTDLLPRRRRARRVVDRRRRGRPHALAGHRPRRASTPSAPRSAPSPVVIADGHHRYETSLAYRDERARPRATGRPAPTLAMVYVVELVDDELTVRPIHRLLVGQLRSRPRGRARRALHVRRRRPGRRRHPRPDGRRGRACPGRPPTGGTFLVPRAGRVRRRRRPRLERLAAALAARPRHEARYQHGVDQVVEALRGGEAEAGVLLRPATVAQIDANAHAGERMPPKTTFFHPKPRTGPVFRPTD